MKNLSALFLLLFALPLFSQDLFTLPQSKDYVQHRASSYDRTGANADFRPIAPGETLTVLDESGPGLITHLWFTIAADDPYQLKALVLRIFWDAESSPSVETPIGDFFGLGLGDYFIYQSVPLRSAPIKLLNSFFPHALSKARPHHHDQRRQRTVDAFYFNIEYRIYAKPLPPDTALFPRAISPGRAESRLDEQWQSQRRPARE